MALPAGLLYGVDQNFDSKLTLALLVCCPLARCTLATSMAGGASSPPFTNERSKPNVAPELKCSERLDTACKPIRVLVKPYCACAWHMLLPAAGSSGARRAHNKTFCFGTRHCGNSVLGPAQHFRRLFTNTRSSIPNLSAPSQQSGSLVGPGLGGHQYQTQAIYANRPSNTSQQAEHVYIVSSSPRISAGSHTRIHPRERPVEVT